MGLSLCHQNFCPFDMDPFCLRVGLCRDLDIFHRDQGNHYRDLVLAP